MYISDEKNEGALIKWRIELAATILSGLVQGRMINPEEDVTMAFTLADELIKQGMK